MKIKTIDHASGVFKNYEGVDQHFDVALVSYIPDSAFCTVIDREVGSIDAKIIMGIGTAFCKPKTITCPDGDEYNPEIGRKIAVAHAMDMKKAFTTISQSEMGFIDAAIRSAILTNIVNNIKEEPERYSYKYSLDKDKYEKERYLVKAVNELDERLENIYYFFSSCTDEEINYLNHLLKLSNIKYSLEKLD